ncbi:hypothetical protein LF599_03730 [Pseudodesulfovibrio thermohalotolerans]|uniref:hypothetical protein n=1 Tax=Pseudodesulfovibrio thermohalotolerans TaxID=2880651 RepID=UPI002442614D|nr:hypothetical protein [Pseudodesulfovibrio thermohalotolerans]WFS63287.1 hypothetical protein LF599_03730 [Pseudodesulfovibrio thermohalotolerans]
MRLNNQHPQASSAVAAMPFAGLGFASAEVRQAAKCMTPVVHRPCGDPVFIPVGCGPAVQPGGYKLLVALGREIRGR